MGGGGAPKLGKLDRLGRRVLFSNKGLLSGLAYRCWGGCVGVNMYIVDLAFDCDLIIRSTLSVIECFVRRMIVEVPRAFREFAGGFARLMIRTGGGRYE